MTAHTDRQGPAVVTNDECRNVRNGFKGEIGNSISNVRP